jgi:hypothetical protein
MPPRKIFVSYSHAQKDWVHDRLCPCLQASGADVKVDKDRFGAGHEVLRQMDGLQDEADATLAVLSPDYVASNACMHELRRSVAKDRGFTGGTIPVHRADCAIPDELNPGSLQAPLRVDLRDDTQPGPWADVFKACHSDLGAEAPHWLETRDEVRRMLKRNESVNLIVHGQPKWRHLIHHLAGSESLRIVDLALPETITRPGLLSQMLGHATLPNKPKGQDLVEFKRHLESIPDAVSMALLHCEVIEQRNYGSDLFFTLRHLVSEVRKLQLLIVTREKSFVTFVPAQVRGSLPTLPVVEFKGRA